ncbi:MAG: Ig-like domain-containing protein [Burkholderiales bacterium]|nr:Ig-like domain-containing protein [Phycisphaerae bacterium]
MAWNMGRTSLVWLLVVFILGSLLLTLSGKFARTELAQHVERAARPHVTGSRPAAGAKDVAPVTGIAADITLPNTGAGVDPKTLDAGVSLIRTRDGAVIPAGKNTSGSGDAIVLKPIDPLDKDAEYHFTVNSNLKDTSGASFAPFEMKFTTAKDFAESEFPAAFEKVAMSGLTLDQNAFTSLAIGPDGLIYAGTFAGMIYRFEITPDGTLAPREPLMTVLQHNGGPRLVTGVAFDPASTRENPILWSNHGQMAVTPEGKLEGADDWTGKLSRLSGPGFSQYQDVLINLPRAYKDHLNFQIAFGADGALYFTQGSHTSVGEIDKKWGYRPERKLSAAVLRLDVQKLKQLPLDVKTDDGGTYDPSAPDAPLTLFATGVRSGFDLLPHRNGKLYCGVNGAGGNEGNTPGSPDGKVTALRDFKSTTSDTLLRIEAGRYYGHPNPTRHQYVLNGGNPTAGADPMEVSEYPVGTLPESNYAPPALDFGKNYSPNGLIEYKGARFGGALDGCILVTRYSDGKDILVLHLNSAGDVVETIAGVDGFTGFVDPLDLLEDDKTGNIYVAEYGGRTISLLRPIEGKPSRHAQRIKVGVR